jgi:hypothetical protein
MPAILSSMPRRYTVPEVYVKGFFDTEKVAVRQNVLWLYEETPTITTDEVERQRGSTASNSSSSVTSNVATL